MAAGGERVKAGGVRLQAAGHALLGRGASWLAGAPLRAPLPKLNPLVQVKVVAKQLCESCRSLP